MSTNPWAFVTGDDNWGMKKKGEGASVNITMTASGPYTGRREGVGLTESSHLKGTMVKRPPVSVPGTHTRNT